MSPAQTMLTIFDILLCQEINIKETPKKKQMLFAEIETTPPVRSTRDRPYSGVVARVIVSVG